uniref:JmjC domain-containing protein n=1 Tax=Ditylenchus dipsaci TaxID=166011 RepID=A0A915CPG1_9BILA
MLFNDPIGYAGELSSQFGPQPIGLHVKDSHMDRLFSYFCRQYNKRQKIFDEVGAVKIVPSAKWSKSNKGDTSTLADVDVPVLSQRSIVTTTGGIFVLPKQLSARPLKAVARKSLPRPRDFPSNMQDVPDYMWKSLATGKMQAEYATSFEVDPTLCQKLDLMSFRGILGALKRHEDVRTIFGFFGTYGSVFCFHTEDFEALSVNILLDGAPKYWIVIAAEHRDKFNQLTAKLYSQENTMCEKPTSHLNFLVSPAQLQAQDIPYTEFIQYPGEIMVIMAGAHHAGFNLGVNYSENVYCGHPSMLEQLKKTNNLCCDCKEEDGKTRKHLPLNRSELDKLEEAAR